MLNRSFGAGGRTASWTTAVFFAPLIPFIVVAVPPSRGDLIFDDAPDRVWIGPDFFANRLQDWRVRDGRIECVEARPSFPLRTAHILTRPMTGAADRFELDVVIGAIDSDQPLTGEAMAGLLIGAGGTHVDYRISAMVHASPAEDGGIILVIDGNGMVTVRSNSQPREGAGQWSIGGPVSLNQLPELEGIEKVGRGFGDDPSEPVRLSVLGVRTNKGSFDIAFRAERVRDGGLVSECHVEAVDPSNFDGSIGLLSHLGAEDGSAGFWFDDLNLHGPGIEHRPERGFGPIMSTMYTVHERVLKLTAQTGPLGEQDSQTAVLQTRWNPDDPWMDMATATFEPDSCTFPFRVEAWNTTTPAEYRVVYDLVTTDGKSERHTFEGRITSEPWDKDEFVLAVLTCQKIYTGGLKWNQNGIWFPHTEVVEGLRYFEPDLLYFSGDQIYEGDLTPAIRQPIETAIHDYLYKWYRHCWSFRDLMREIPTVCTPDDHDVYHGNIWGAANIKADPDPRFRYAQDRGGYTMPPRFVNAVHATQTSHLPDPVDPTPLLGGISVYYTRLDCAGVSCAILADRQFKSAPAVFMPKGEVVNGWFQNEEFDPSTQADIAGADLLGSRQLRFLHDWATDWSNGSWMKIAMSQSVFSNVATIPEDAQSGSVIPSLPLPEKDEYPDGYKLAADCDSNGWPPSGRDRAIREIRRCFALHVSGDQHLGTVIRYGIDGFDDAGYSFCVPAVANTWPRRWFPPPGAGSNRAPGAPMYTGRFFDGFGNRMTVHAAANPYRTGQEPANLYDRVPGYGIVRLKRSTRQIELECWPRWVNPSEANAKQYEGWPLRLHQLENDGRQAVGHLPTIVVRGLDHPVVQVINERTGQLLYTFRLPGNSIRVWIYEPDDPHTVRVGSPDRDLWRSVEHLRRVEDPESAWPIAVEF